MCKKCEYITGKRVVYHPHIPQNKLFIKKQKITNEENRHSIRSLYSALFIHLSTPENYFSYLLNRIFTHNPQQLLLPSLLIYKEEL